MINPFKVGDKVRVTGRYVQTANSMESNCRAPGGTSIGDILTVTGLRGQLVEFDENILFGGWDHTRFELAPNLDLDKAKKESDGKSPFQILFQLPGLKDVSDVFLYGMNKYSEFNWREGKNQSGYKMKLMGAALRHCFAYMTGEKSDPESGKPHLAHAVCNLLMVADLEILESK